MQAAKLNGTPLLTARRYLTVLLHDFFNVEIHKALNLNYNQYNLIRPSGAFRRVACTANNLLVDLDNTFAFGILFT